MSYSDCSVELLETRWTRHGLNSRSPPPDLNVHQRSVSMHWTLYHWHILFKSITRRRGPHVTLFLFVCTAPYNKFLSIKFLMHNFFTEETLKVTLVSRWLGTSYSNCAVNTTAWTWFKHLLRVGVARQFWSRCPAVHKICIVFPSLARRQSHIRSFRFAVILPCVYDTTYELVLSIEVLNVKKGVF